MIEMSRWNTTRAGIASRLAQLLIAGALVFGPAGCMMPVLGPDELSDQDRMLDQARARRDLGMDYLVKGQNVIALRVTDEVSTALEIDETIDVALARLEAGINSIDLETPGVVIDVDTTERDIMISGYRILPPFSLNSRMISNLHSSSQRPMAMVIKLRLPSRSMSKGI